MNDKNAKDAQGKNEQLEEFREESDGTYLTTNQGLKINHTDDSLNAGDRGPTLMEDFHFREKMTHFDHERIPERVVHARGSAAHGYFQVYEPLGELTRAKFLQDPSIKTPVFVRFSTVVGFRGSADTVRDARGFATKFFTEEGNFDLVGNNMPVFFIQDAIKFPDLVHAIKPEPDNEMPQASAAHDNFWDFISLMPEAAHMIMWVLSDRALPRSYSMMEGFGVHTFRFVNESGKSRFVKFHWKPLAGVHSLSWDESQKIAGKDPDFNRRDLWEAIEMGNYPEFELGVQVVEEENEFSFDFDLLDATKLIPEEEVPVRIVGKMTLNRNPDNFFAETEQVAFHPGHVVPGIDFTNDPLLQGRLFSYTDTQLIRLGGPNFAEIPINRPLAPVHNNQRDGFSRQTINKGKVNYFPNSRAKGCPMMAPENLGGYVHYAEKVEGRKVAARSDSFKDHFSQATLFYNSLSPTEKQHLISAAVFEWQKCESKDLRQALVNLFANASVEMATTVAARLGINPPDTNGIKNHGKSSAALSMAGKNPMSAKGRKVAIVVEDGFSQEQVENIQAALKAEGAMADIVSTRGGTVSGVTGGDLDVDKTFLTTASVVYDAVFIPGGDQSVQALLADADAVEFVRDALKHCKPVGAIQDGITLVGKANPFSSMDVLKIPDSLQNHKGIVTTRDEKQVATYATEFLTAVKNHRYWEREM